MSANPYQTQTEHLGGQVSGEQADFGAGAGGLAETRQGKHRPQKNQMMRANLFLAGLCVTGAAIVYGLSFRKGPAEASAEQRTVEAQVDQALLRLTSSPRSDGAHGPGQVTRDLLENFHHHTIKRQVPIHRLQKNPFQFVPPKSATARIIREGASGGSGESAEPNANITEEEARAVLSTLSLQSVMTGRDGEGTAIISNNLLTVGQRIKCFTVERITSKSVVLSWEGHKYILDVP